MKRILQFIILSIAATTAMKVRSTEIDMDNPKSVAHWAQIDELIRQTRQKALTDDEALKELIRMNYDVNFGSYSTGMLISGMRERASKNDVDEGGISLQREIKVMERMVRDGLSVLEKNGQEHQAYDDVVSCTLMLGALPDYDILPLLKECIKSKIEGVRRNTIIRYIRVKEVETIPFLHNIINEANLTDQSRSNIYQELERTIEPLTRQQRSDDVEKINAFLKEVRQAEQSKIREQPTSKNDTPKFDEKNITSDNGANKFSPPAMTNATDETERSNQQTPPIPPEKSSSNKIILLVSIITLLAVIGGVIAWRKKP